MPGTVQLNAGGNADVTSVTCVSAGNCSVGGYYADGQFMSQAFVLNEVDGGWGTAEQVPGTAQLDTSGFAHVGSVSCASAGNCSADGYYTDASGWHVFVVNEVDGRWGTAEQVPGTPLPNADAGADVAPVSRAQAASSCAGRNYADRCQPRSH